MKFRPYGPAFTLKEEPKKEPKGKCKDCKHFKWIQGMGMHPYCWLHSKELDNHWTGWCYDYKRKWWKIWK